MMMMSSDVNKVGVTRGGNLWCHPIFALKTDDLLAIAFRKLMMIILI